MARPPLVQQHILDLLAQRHSLSAPELVAALESDGSGVNKTSVYRALDHLLEQGKVCRQTLAGDVPTFELRDHHHDHLVCENCGRVQVTECLTNLSESIDGFRVGHHHLTVYGVCPNCQVSLASASSAVSESSSESPSL